MGKNRAISSSFLNELKTGKFKSVLDLVKNNDELCLCFRGIDDSVEIYRNNHQVFKLSEEGETQISFTHASYLIDWSKYAKKLKDYGFPELTNPYQKNKYLKSSFDEITDVKKLYTDIIKEIMDDFFKPFEGKCPKNRKNYFKENVELKCQGRYRAQQTELEKIRQQQLFNNMKVTENGYFVYDLESHEKGNRNGNEPDMLAIGFKNNIPVTLALIEVKSTTGAMTGDHGIKNHIDSMNQYNITDDRFNEAYKILDHYKKLELYPNIGLYNHSKKLEKEILLILTDKAKDKWEKPPRKGNIKKEIEKLENDYSISKNGEITLPDSNKASIFLFNPKCK